ncbi:hypothetical protein [Paenibacillus sp. FSL M8-0142]|uniref:hypothetical protein n=1 Tax=Paenibacillus sp. FSL M8-0142 TaxID=2954525 RepID=UPI003159BF6E
MIDDKAVAEAAYKAMKPEFLNQTSFQSGQHLEYGTIHIKGQPMELDRLPSCFFNHQQFY